MSEGKSFFSTIPGILTGLAALITAMTGLLFALHELGLFNPKAVLNTKVAVDSVQEQPAQTTDGWAIIGKYKSGKFYDLKLMVHDNSPAIGRRYDVVDDFRLVQKRNRSFYTSIHSAPVSLS